MLALAGGFLCAAVAAELVLHALPYSTGYRNTQVDEQQPIGHGTPYFHYTYSRDWSFHLANSGRLNNEGWRASYEYRDDPQGLAVVGNSFVQADAIVPSRAMPERIGALLGRRAFAIGSDGATLADYFSAARWTVEHFGVHTVLVLLTTEDLIHSCTRRPGQYYLQSRGGQLTLQLVSRPPASRWKQLLNSSSLFRYTFDNLHVTANWIKGWRRDAPDFDSEPEPAAPTVRSGQRGCASAEFEAAATRFLLSSFGELQARDSARIIFILAPDYRQQHTVFGAFRDVDRFAEDAAKAGFEVVPLRTAFETAERAGVKLTLVPIDHHWTAAANEVAAQAVAGYLRAGNARAR